MEHYEHHRRNDGGQGQRQQRRHDHRKAGEHVKDDGDHSLKASNMSARQKSARVLDDHISVVLGSSYLVVVLNGKAGAFLFPAQHVLEAISQATVHENFQYKDGEREPHHEVVAPKDAQGPNYFESIRFIRRNNFEGPHAQQADS